METGRAHQSLPDRQEIEKPEAVTRHSEESQHELLTCISQTPCLSFRELSREQHLLGADDHSFRRWCWDGQEIRNVGISNQTLSFSSPTKIRTDSWSTRKTIRRSYPTLWKDSWKKAWRKTVDKHPPAKPTHFKEKQSFSLMNSSSLGWVIAKWESSSKVQRGARMPGQRRAGQLVRYNLVCFLIASRSTFSW